MHTHTVKTIVQREPETKFYCRCPLHNSNIRKHAVFVTLGWFSSRHLPKQGLEKAINSVVHFASTLEGARHLWLGTDCPINGK